MSAVRLSPAANLLRNSKLFALPPAIALPSLEPSSEPVPRSDTATTIYPTRAAIETTGTSLFRGDWGLKRPLPLKSTTRSRVIRLNNGIDTREHVADFDSATDHVMTLKKFQELNAVIQYPQPVSSDAVGSGSVFNALTDNTTNVSATAPFHTKHTGVWPDIDPKTIPAELPRPVRRKLKEVEAARYGVTPAFDPARAGSVRNDKPKRWRFAGPSLVQMSSLEFEQYLRTLDISTQTEFRALVRERASEERTREAVDKARAEGTVGEPGTEPLHAMSESDVDAYMRDLRHDRDKFGKLIAEFLDLPDGPSAPTVANNAWGGARNVSAAEHYDTVGTPRTHPSAGLSYIHHDRFAENDAILGPQQSRQPIISRLVKIRSRSTKNNGTHGVAGFVAHPLMPKGSSIDPVPAFEPGAGGQKTAVKIHHVGISEKGAATIKVKPVQFHVIQDDEVVHQASRRRDGIASLPTTPRPSGRIMPRLSTSNNYRRTEPVKEDEDVSDILGAMIESARNARS